MTWPHVIWHITRAAPLSQHVITRLAGLRVITCQALERTQVSIAMHRTLMHAYHDRWLRVRARWEQESGQSAVTALELRFQGSGRA